MIEDGKLKTKVLNVLAPNTQATFRDISKGSDRMQAAKASLNHIRKTVSFWIKTVCRGSVRVGHLKEEYYEYLNNLNDPDYKAEITGGKIFLCYKNGEEIKEIVHYADVTKAERALIAAGEYTIRSRHFGMNVEVSEKLPE